MNQTPEGLEERFKDFISNELQVKNKWKWYKNPIKWYKNRKTIALCNIFLNHQWQNGMREKVQELQNDMFLHGTAIIDKKGNRVDPTNI